MRALEIDINCFQAWSYLFETLRDGEKVQVGSDWYDKKQCCLRSLSIDNTYTPAWTHLGLALGDDSVTIDGISYGAQKCWVCVVVLCFIYVALAVVNRVIFCESLRRGLEGPCSWLGTCFVLLN